MDLTVATTIILAISFDYYSTMKAAVSSSIISMKVPDSPAEICHTHFHHFAINDDTFKTKERKYFCNPPVSDFVVNCKCLENPNSVYKIISISKHS